MTGLLKLLGPKLGVAAAGVAVATLLGISLGGGQDLPPDRPNPVEGDQSDPSTTPKESPTVQERARDNPVAVNPHELMVRRVLPIEGPFRHGDYVWNEDGAPAAGRIIVTVDLKAQTLSVFRDGYEIGAAVILYGADDKPSPVGAFPITQKKKDHISNLYNAPMPFMQRLTNDGVAIHGSNVQWGSATHGCIGIPLPFAEKLFGATKVGDLVIITDGKMLDTSHLKPEA